MRTSTVLLICALALTISLVKTHNTHNVFKLDNSESEKVPLFVRSLKNLYKGPPVPRIKTKELNVKTEWIEQKLDHFDANEQRAWQMRYMVNDEFFEKGGPMFIFLSNNLVSITRISSRPWYYQTCNEYGWYQSSGSSNQPFGRNFPVTLYTTMCYDIFGDKYTNEHINFLASQTNVDFGGMNPEVENVFMTHGGLDPWNAIGHGEEDGATIIPRYAHCKDLGSINVEEDSKSLLAAKERIAELVRVWLAA